MNLTGWGAAIAAEVSNGCPFDASKYGGITFWAKGTSSVFEGPNRLMVAVGNPEDIPSELGGFCNDTVMPPDPSCYARHRIIITLTPDWKQYTIAWTDLMPPSYYMTGAAFGANRVRDIVFNASGPSKPTDPATSFDFWVDELSFTAPGTPGNIPPDMGSGGSGGASGGSGGASGGTGGASGGTGGSGGASGGTGGASGGTGGA